MVWQPGELGGKVRFCRLFATIVAFFWRSGKTQRIKIPLWALNMHRMPNFSTIFPAKDNGDIITGKIKLKDFGITTDLGPASQDVELIISVEGVREK